MTHYDNGKIHAHVPTIISGSVARILDSNTITKTADSNLYAHYQGFLELTESCSHFLKVLLTITEH